MVVDRLKNFNKKDTLEFSYQMRKKILEMSYSAGSASAHIGGALSCTDIISVIFSKFLKYKKENPFWHERDRFILSKGHACLAYYAALNQIGILNDQDLSSFEKDNSNLAGHPVKNLKKGIEFSTGSLGMGISIAVGLCIAFKKKKVPNKVFVVVGDGECNEGSNWEALMSASHYNLDNLVIFIDKNNLQQTGACKEILTTENLSEKFKSFNCFSREIDGHDHSQIFRAISQNLNSPKPNLIVANTVKGKGIEFFENKNEWHHSVLSKKVYDEALSSLDKNYDS
jgi:transketolase